MRRTRLPYFSHQGREDALEYAEEAPTHKAAEERFVRAVAARCCSPLQAVTDDVDDAADDPPVVSARHRA